MAKYLLRCAGGYLWRFLWFRIACSWCACNGIALGVLGRYTPILEGLAGVYLRLGDLGAAAECRRLQEHFR